MIVRLAVKRRFPMVHVVRREEQVRLLRSLGAEVVLDASQPDFDAELRQACKRLGVSIAFDAVAGELTGRLLHAMPRGGRVLVYGALSEAACAVHPGDLIFGDKAVEGFWLTTWLRARPLLQNVRAGVAVQRALASDFRTEVRARLPLAAATEGLAQYQRSMTSGKVLFVPDHGKA
jgi:NADPH:quinone reductase-like Zn-dependent oxidoreductase